MDMAYKIFWKHKDFQHHSEGPILKHSEKGRTKFGKLYTKLEAARICEKFQKAGKEVQGLPIVTHYVREVLI